MSNLYRLYPTLWNDGDGQDQQALTVYAVDGGAPLFPTACSRRPSEDPAYSWSAPTFQRLLPPTPPVSYGALTSVTWSTLFAWIRYANTLGYTVQGDLSKLKATSDLYVMGP